jgi:hypothetical protein
MTALFTGGLATVVTRPVLLTVATLALEEVHLAELVTLMAPPDWPCPVKRYFRRVNCWVELLAMGTGVD